MLYTYDHLKDLSEKALGNLNLPDEAGALFEPVRYTLSAGGKRIRPVLTLMACNIFTDKIDHAVLPAAGFEIFHNFTLVHDDIMDNAAVRRNLPAVHVKWNLNQAILSGDVMAFIANSCFLHLPPEQFLPAFKIYNQTAVEVCIGQQLDMDFEKLVTVSESEYLRMIELKTAVLLSGCLRTGALIGGAGQKEINLLGDLGKNLGLAFQIQDDLLDVYSEPGKFGKAKGGDIISGKKTFLLVKAMELARGNKLKILQSLINDRNHDPGEKISTVTEIYDSLDIKSISEKKAEEYISSAMDNLENLSVPAERKSELRAFAEALARRST